MEHVGNLSCGKGHSIVLLPAKAINDFSRIKELAIRAFHNVDTLPDAEGIKGHPEGPNSMMRQAIWHMQMANLGPWMYCEPDCIPLESDTFDVWEREYRAYGKPFMGEFRPAHDVTPDYLSGNMMLPKDALLAAPMLARRGLSRDGVELAFDIVAASQTLPLAHLTKLLHQVPKTESGGGATFPDQASLARIRPGAVFFHPCKDGSLCERLREKSGEVRLNLNPVGVAMLTAFQTQEASKDSTSEIRTAETILHAENGLLVEEVGRLNDLVEQLRNTILNLEAKLNCKERIVPALAAASPKKKVNGRSMKKKRTYTTAQLDKMRAHMANVRAMKKQKTA